MISLVIAGALLGLAFAAGYATREIISRKRRAEYTEYLEYEPYLPRMTKVEAETSERAKDLARKFASPSPQKTASPPPQKTASPPPQKSASPPPQAPRADANPAVTVADQEGLDELLRRMEREIHAKGPPGIQSVRGGRG